MARGMGDHSGRGVIKEMLRQRLAIPLPVVHAPRSNEDATTLLPSRTYSKYSYSLTFFAWTSMAPAWPSSVKYRIREPRGYSLICGSNAVAMLIGRFSDSDGLLSATTRYMRRGRFACNKRSIMSLYLKGSLLVPCPYAFLPLIH